MNATIDREQLRTRAEHETARVTGRLSGDLIFEREMFAREFEALAALVRRAKTDDELQEPMKALSMCLAARQSDFMNGYIRGWDEAMKRVQATVKAASRP